MTVLTVVVLDQWSKFEIRTNPALQHKQIIKGWLAFHYTQNPGMAFGLEWLPTPVIGLISLAAIVGILIYTFRIADQATVGHMICMGMIVGGATGNFIDRMFLAIIQGYGGFLQGYVVDFIHFTFSVHGDEVFPYIFNVADSSITVSVVILLVFHRYLLRTADSKTSVIQSGETPENKGGEASDSHASGIGVDSFSNL